MKLAKIRPPRAVQCVLCAVVSFTVTVFGNAATIATLEPFDVRALGAFALTFIVLLTLFVAGEFLIGCTRMHYEQGGSDKFAGSSVKLRSSTFLGRLVAWWAGIGNPVRGVLLTAVLLLCWSPVIVAMFPGTVWYDAGEQIAQFQGYSVRGSVPGTISAHHPVLDTIIFGLFARLGSAMGSLRAGIAVLIMLQVVAMCVGLAATVLYVHAVGGGTVASVLLFAWFAFYPALPIIMMSLVKDTLHLIVLVPWMLLYTQTVRTRLDSLRSPWFIMWFVLLSVLCSLTTMTGLYITVLSLALLPLQAFRGKRRKQRALRALTVFLVSALLAFVAFPALVYGPLRVYKDDANQILVVPMQMTGRYALDNPDDVTVQERNAIDTVNLVPFRDMPERYNPYLADPIIQYSLKDSKAVMPYISAWLSMGLRHPQSYVNGFAALESGWFSLIRTPITGTGHPIRLDDLKQTASQPVPNRMIFQIDDSYSPEFLLLPGHDSQGTARDAINRLWETTCSIPVVNLTTLTAVWTFLLPAFLLFCRLRTIRRKRASDSDDNQPMPSRSHDDIRDPRHLDRPFAMLAVPLIWSLLSLLANAISIPLKPTATRYMIWAVIMIPFLIVLLHADRVRANRFWITEPALAHLDGTPQGGIR